MKKSIVIIAIILALMLSFVGCSNNESTTNTNPEQKTENETVTNSDESGSTEAASNNEAEVAQESKGIDKSLSGLQLLKTLQYKAPKSLKLETEMKMGELVTKIVTYYKGESSRIETDTPYGIKSVLIYNANDKTTYHYNEGDKTGIIMGDGGSMNMLDMDMSAPTFSDLTADAPEDIVARIETLDGEEVVYIETNDVDEGVEAKIMMWFSTKYMIPLKLEVNAGGQVVLSQEVTNLDTNSNIDDSLFVPPSDIEFSELSMNDMFGGDDE